MKKKEKSNFEVWMNQANSVATLGSLLKGMKLKCSEVVRVIESVRDQQAPEGPMMKVVLITEGLGNRRNMNYYGIEAIRSAPAVFEGKPCYLDHPSESEARDIPERRVRQKCGYFKNCHVEMLESRQSLVGELHFDLSDDGTQGYLKALTSLHYRSEFPGLESEYVGLSINADGEVEDRRVEWEGELLDVNYVARFTDAVSCDIVTSPARGGRFLALVESAAGANPKQEGPMKKGLEKTLKAAQTALEEADKEKTPDVKATKVAEANKLFKQFLSEAMQAADQDEPEVVKESDKTKDADANKGEEASDAEKKKKADDEKAKDKDVVESKRIAISALAKEGNVDLTEEKLDKLSALPLSEAKAEIADLKKMVESVTKRVINSVATPSARFAAMNEADRKASGSVNNDLFADLSQ